MALNEDEKNEVERIVSTSVNQCRAEVDERLNLMHHDMNIMHQDFVGVKSEVSDLRQTVQKIEASTSRIAISMETIAESYDEQRQKLGDLPETWGQIKSFFAVLGWFRDNWFLFVILGLLIYLTLGYFGVRLSMGGGQP